MPERLLWDVFLTGRPLVLPRGAVTRAHLIGRVGAATEEEATEAAFETFGVDEREWRTCDPLRSIGPEDEIEVRQV